MLNDVYSPLVERVPPVRGQSALAVHPHTDLRSPLILLAQPAHQFQRADLFVRKQPQTLVLPDIDPIRLGAHERRPDHHPPPDEADRQTEVVAEETEAPWLGRGGLPLRLRDGRAGRKGGGGEEEAEVVRVLVEDLGTVDELAQEVVGERAAYGFLEARRGERCGEYRVDEGDGLG